MIINVVLPIVGILMLVGLIWWDQVEHEHEEAEVSSDRTDHADCL
jgi:hypothetical protein